MREQAWTDPKHRAKELFVSNFKYLWYVLCHKWYVYQAGRKLGVGRWQLIIHDWTKFLPSEFIAYRNNFFRKDWATWENARLFGEYGLGELIPYGMTPRERFDVAWNHHQKRNKHHWQYWLLLENKGEIKRLIMPEKYVREMVADWAGAGRAISGKWEVEAWYQKNKDKMLMREETRKRVEELLASVK